MIKLDPSSWLPQAMLLPLGTKRKVKHVCGSDKSMSVYHNVMAYSAKCYRCGGTGFSIKVLTLAERLAILNADRSLQQTNNTIVTYPSDSTDVLTSDCIVYLSSRGVSTARALALGVKYHTPSRRLVLPITDDGALIGILNRCVDQYRTAGRPRFVQYGASNNTRIGVINGPVCVSPRSIVITEDLLSAWNVGRVIDAGAVIGTVLNTQHLTHLYDYDRFILWLDGDTHGRAGSRAAKKLLELLGKQVIEINSPLDPKYYSLHELTTVLGGIDGCKNIKDYEVQVESRAIRWTTRRSQPRTNDIKVTT